jgi:hypothetical protein
VFCCCDLWGGGRIAAINFTSTNEHEADQGSTRKGRMELFLSNPRYVFLERNDMAHVKPKAQLSTLEGLAEILRDVSAYHDVHVERLRLVVTTTEIGTNR